MEESPDRLDAVAGFKLRGGLVRDQLSLPQADIAVGLRELSVLE